jgi:hypothetical protein
MKIKFIKEEALHIFRNNADPINNFIQEHNNKSWIQTFLGKNWFGETKIEVPDFNFYIDHSKKPIDTDFDNGVMLYETLKQLNETQASDERLWVGLSLSEGYDYLMYRWGFDNNTRFKYRWIFFTKGKRALLYHGLARLWWFVRITVDKTLDNPYEITEFAFKYQGVVTKLMYRNYANSRKVVLAILSVLMEFERNGYVISMEMVNELYKEVSLMGSVSIIDAFSREELEYKIRKKIEKILKIQTV